MLTPDKTMASSMTVKLRDELDLLSIDNSLMFLPYYKLSALFVPTFPLTLPIPNKANHNFAINQWMQLSIDFQIIQ